MNDFIIKLEKEVSSWSDFRRTFRGEDRKYFNQVIYLMRKYPEAAKKKAYPLLMNPLFINVLLEHQIEIEEIKKKLEKMI